MRILVDMDDVLCAWTKQYDEEVKRYPGLGLTSSAENPTFDKFSGLSDEALKAAYEIFNLEGFYRKLEPIEGGIDAVKAMHGEGHEVYIVSAPWQGNPTCASDKYAWVNEHLGVEWTYRTILTNNKGLVSGDILIDDRPEVRGWEVADWKHIYFTHPHNEGLPGLRLDSWKDWRNVLSFA